MGAKRGRVLVEFATLEDLERIYKLMVGVRRSRRLRLGLPATESEIRGGRAWPEPSGP